jgi:hypothetical protein
MEVWTTVKVKNTDHDRFGQAGVVHAVHPKNTDTVDVKFDVDGEVLNVKTEDLQVLSQ